MVWTFEYFSFYVEEDPQQADQEQKSWGDKGGKAILIWYSHVFCPRVVMKSQ